MPSYKDLQLSERNEKLGEIWNFNLQVGRTCPMQCKGCYANKGRHLFDSVQVPRIANTDFLFSLGDDLGKAEAEFIEFFNSHIHAKMFRIHESGDFYSVAYAKMWYGVMEKCPHVKFCVYTKAYDIVRQVPFYKLKNCSLKLSSWIGLEIPEDLREHYGVAWFEDDAGLETRIPEGTFVCPGKARTCKKCRYCWKPGLDVVLKEH